MRHQIPQPADIAPHDAIVAMVSEVAAERVLEHNFPRLAMALDQSYGRKGWFMFWDEDLCGRPIVGTISIAYGGETMVVG